MLNFLAAFFTLVSLRSAIPFMWSEGMDCMAGMCAAVAMFPAPITPTFNLLTP